MPQLFQSIPGKRYKPAFQQTTKFFKGGSSQILLGVIFVAKYESEAPHQKRLKLHQPAFRAYFQVAVHDAGSSRVDDITEFLDGLSSSVYRCNSAATLIGAKPPRRLLMQSQLLFLRSKLHFSNNHL